jgi:hypothetical protein
LRQSLKILESLASTLGRGSPIVRMEGSTLRLCVSLSCLARRRIETRAFAGNSAYNTEMLYFCFVLL